MDDPSEDFSSSSEGVWIKVKPQHARFLISDANALPRAARKRKTRPMKKRAHKAKGGLRTKCSDAVDAPRNQAETLLENTRTGVRGTRNAHAGGLQPSLRVCAPMRGCRGKWAPILSCLGTKQTQRTMIVPSPGSTTKSGVCNGGQTRTLPGPPSRMDSRLRCRDKGSLGDLHRPRLPPYSLACYPAKRNHHDRNGPI